MKSFELSKLKALTIITGIFFLCYEPAYSQARKPTLMVVPSDVWCNQHGYLMEFDNQGVTERVPDYQRALQENPNLLMVISKLNELMADRGFPLKDLESSLRSLKMQSAEDNMLTNDSGGQLAESPIDALKRVAQADIWMQVTWTLNQQGPKRSISYVLRGLDAYTNKQIAGASGTGKPSFSVELPVLLEEAVVAHLDKFNKQLQNYFDDMFAKGREVALRVRVWNNWDHDLEDYFGDEDLSEIIEDWMYDNTKQGRFSTTIATENQMFFEQVRIPLFDDRDRAIDTRRWARDLQKFLRKKYAIEAKLMMKGLGQAQLVLGER